MNKVAKSAIAAGAAAALLLGGSGTLALWSGSGAVDAGSVTVGHLTLDTTAEGKWTDTSADAGNTGFEPATDKLVPGDTVQFKQTVAISAVGKNLKGALTVGTLPGTPELPAGVTVQIVPTIVPATPNLSVVGNVVSFEAPGEYNVDVTVTVGFAKGLKGDTPAATMDAAVDLSALTLTLDQVRP